MSTAPVVRGQRAVLRLLDDAGVDHVLLRGSLGGGDLDLLVAPLDVPRAVAVLGQAGIVRAPSEHHWPHQLLVGFTDALSGPDDGPVHLAVDVVDRVTVRGLLVSGRALVSQVLAARVVDPDGVPRPAPADAGWVDALSELLRPAGTRTGSVPTALDTDARVARALDADHGAGTAVGVAARVAAGDLDGARTLLLGLRRRRPLGARLASRRALWTSRLAARPGRTGLRIVLLGPDGAGKSTLSAGLVRALPLPVHEIYMGVFRVNTWQRVSRYLPGAGLATRLATLTWRSAKGQWYARRGHVVVFDRYTYDAGLRPGSRGLRARLSYFVIERAVPAPDLVVVLDAPGAVMFERKHEHDVATLEERRHWYLDLAATLPNAVVVDATQSQEVVLEQAVAAAWRTIRER